MRILLTVPLLALLSCSQAARATDDRQPSDESAANHPTPSARPGRQPVEVEMNNVDLRVTSDVTLHVRHLRGRFVPAGRAETPYLDDKHSYSVAIDSGEIAMDMASLNALMTSTLDQGDANVEKIQISTDEKNQLRQKGLLAATVKALGIPMRPLMKALGIEMDDLMKVKPGHGIAVQDNDLILDPQQLVPPPSIRGKVTSVRVTDGALVQTFGSGERQRLSPPAISRNYIYWRGNELQFGKLTMTETDLELIDDDPDDPFDFSVDHWNDQLVAGYSKNTSNRGLKTHLPDYNDLKRKSTR